MRELIGEGGRSWKFTEQLLPSGTVKVSLFVRSAGKVLSCSQAKTSLSRKSHLREKDVATNVGAKAWGYKITAPSLAPHRRKAEQLLVGRREKPVSACCPQRLLLEITAHVSPQPQTASIPPPPSLNLPSSPGGHKFQLPKDSPFLWLFITNSAPFMLKSVLGEQ